MMKNYMTTRTFTKGKNLKGDSTGKVVAPFPKEKAAMSIYDEPAPHESWRKLKLTRQAVNVVSPSAPKYICWFESPITFDRMDHPGSITKLGMFPLVVDPLVGMTRLTKDLMDGGNDLNLVYLTTFDGLELTQD
jgi:hypothetical protein